MISVLVVGVMYLAMNVAILGVIPWREVVSSNHIASDLVLKVYGSWAARLATLFIVWTAFASVFAAMLGYSRIPFAAARAGAFLQGIRQAASRWTVSSPIPGLDRRSGVARLSRRARDGH